MKRYFREVIGKPPPVFLVYNIFVDKTYVWRFTLAIKFDCLFLAFFEVFIDLCL